jgi:hypothetical protein
VRLLRRAFHLASHERFQVVHHAIMGNHVHLLVEAQDARALSRGMQGLGIRIARGVQRLQGHRGRVLDERYHAHILATLLEVLRARRYLLDNARHHFGLPGPDWCASQVALRRPRTWLMYVAQPGQSCPGVPRPAVGNSRRYSVVTPKSAAGAGRAAGPECAMGSGHGPPGLDFPALG